MEPLEVDFFFSFRSPWSYLAVPRLLELQTDYTAKVNLRVVDPLYIRFNAFFDKAPEKWLHYFRIDLIRHLEYLGMPLGPPRPDPINDQLPADSTDHLVPGPFPAGVTVPVTLTFDVSCSPVRVIASSAPNGSSISRMSGSTARARDMPMRCRWPPDS